MFRGFKDVFALGSKSNKLKVQNTPIMDLTLGLIIDFSNYEGRFLSADYQDLTWKWYHISTTLFFHTMDPDPSVNPFQEEWPLKTHFPYLTT